MKSPKTAAFVYSLVVAIAMTFDPFSYRVLAAGHCNDASKKQLKTETVELKVGNNSKLLQNLLAWGTITAGTLMPFIALAKGGFSGSGGGGGVATFNNAKDAEIARKLIAEGKPLPKNLLKNAKIRTVERWEMDHTESLKPFKNDNGDSWPTLHAKAKDNLRILSSVTFRLLNQVSDWMAFAEWSAIDALPNLPDATLRHQLGDREVRVQLAIRLSEGNSLPGKGPTRDRIKLKVIFNKTLFDLLDPLDQAILVLHEELYALAQAAGNNHSDEIRPLVELFFSEYFADLRARSGNGIIPAGSLPFFKLKLLSAIGDYPVFFADHKPPPRGAPRSADRHFAVFVDVITELRKLMKTLQEEGHAAPLRPSFSEDATVEPPPVAKKAFDLFANHPDITDEQAFVFLSYFLLERMMKAVNAEAIMDSQRSPRELQEALDHTCKVLKEISPRLNPQFVPIEKALRYCR